MRGREEYFIKQGLAKLLLTFSFENQGVGIADLRNIEQGDLAQHGCQGVGDTGTKIRFVIGPHTVIVTDSTTSASECFLRTSVTEVATGKTIIISSKEDQLTIPAAEMVRLGTQLSWDRTHDAEEALFNTILLGQILAEYAETDTLELEQLKQTLVEKRDGKTGYSFCKEHDLLHEALGVADILQNLFERTYNSSDDYTDADADGTYHWYYFLGIPLKWSKVNFPCYLLGGIILTPVQNIVKLFTEMLPLLIWQIFLSMLSKIYETASSTSSIKHAGWKVLLAVCTIVTVGAKFTHFIARAITSPLDSFRESQGVVPVISGAITLTAFICAAVFAFPPLILLLMKPMVAAGVSSVLAAPLAKATLFTPMAAKVIGDFSVLDFGHIAKP